MRWFRCERSSHVTSFSYPASGPQEFRREYGEAYGNHYERRSRQNDQGNSDLSHGPANDSDDNTFGGTKIRSIQEPRMHSVLVVLHRIRLMQMRFARSIVIGNWCQRLRATRQKSVINPS